MGPRLALVAAASLLLAGCGNPTANPAAQERLAIEAVTPEGTEVTVEANETVTFVVT